MQTHQLLNTNDLLNPDISLEDKIKYITLFRENLDKEIEADYYSSPFMVRQRNKLLAEWEKHYKIATEANEVLKDIKIKLKSLTK